MVVYVEFAFAENALLDGALAYLSVKCVRGRTSARRILLSAAAGGAFAVLFPLVSLPAAAAWTVKLLSGALLALIVVRGDAKTTLGCIAVFFFLTFALGGALTAFYTLSGAEYAAGEGFLVVRAPAAIVLCAALFFFLFVRALIGRLYRFVHAARHTVACTLRHRGRTFRWKGLADTGNLLFFHGEPVSVLAPAAALLLFREGDAPVGRIVISTVHGTREVPVFRCEEVALRAGKRTRVKRGALFAAAYVPGKVQMIIHSAWTEA